MKHFPILAGAVLLCCCLAAGGGLASEVLPHRAIYKMSLHKAAGGTDVQSVSGALYYRFEAECDGWTTENRSVLAYQDGDGAITNTDWSYVSWESRDGLSLRFWLRHLTNGAEDEVIRGRAQLTGPEGAGEALFTQPEPGTLSLDAGTLLPTTHLRRLLGIAQTGKNRLRVRMFDGTRPEGPYEVNALVGPERPSAADLAGIFAQAGIVPVPVRPIVMAYFDPAAPDGLPDFEIAVHYRPDGIAETLIQDFGDFSLKGVLMRLEILAKPDC